MNIYKGKIEKGGKKIVLVYEPGRRIRRLWFRLDLCRHSPTGFEWGYGGSGPAQLALAILADALGDDQLALRYHQQFKFDAIATLPVDKGWQMTTDEVLAHVREIQQEESAHEQRS